MQKYAADRADGLTENIAFYWEVGDLLVPLHYNHVLLLQCVCNPADEPAVKVKDSIIEMNMAHVIFDFLYYDIPGPGRYAVIPTDIKFREFGFQIGQQEFGIVCLKDQQWVLTACIAVPLASVGAAGIKTEIHLFIRSRKTS